MIVIVWGDKLIFVLPHSAEIDSSHDWHHTDHMKTIYKILSIYTLRFDPLCRHTNMVTENVE